VGEKRFVEGEEGWGERIGLKSKFRKGRREKVGGKF
jgi:hypothetical protein